MKINTILESKKLIVRDVKLDDAEACSKLGVSDRTYGKIDNKKKAEEFIKANIKSKTWFGFVVILKETNKLIGAISLFHLDWYDFKAGEVGYTIRKEYRGKGYAPEAVGLLIDYCFKKMKLRKIYADTEPNNIGSQRVLEKLGFKLEGRPREKNLIKRKWVGELDYGLLRKEWKN